MDGHDGNASNATASGSKSSAPDLPTLQAASHLIHEQLTKDAQTIPDAGEMFTIREEQPFLHEKSFSESLFSAGSQSSASYTIFPGDYRVPFQKRKHIGIPPALWEHFQCMFKVIMKL